MVRCFHANTTNMLGKHMVKMFHFSFNTDFFHNHVSWLLLLEEIVIY